MNKPVILSGGPVILSGAKNLLLILCALVTVLAVSSPATAQFQQQQQRQNPAQRGNFQRRPAQQNYFLDLKQIADKLGTRHDAKIVVDPAIIVATKPTPPSDDASLNAALDALSLQLRKVAWRKVYLKKNVNLGPADNAKLAEAVRALELIDQAGLVLENPVARQASAFTKAYPVSGTFNQELEDQAYTTKPVYVLFSLTARPGAGKSLEERMADLQKEQMDLMMQMDPDQMSAALGQGMQMWMNMDPAMRGQLMGSMMRAGMQMFQQMPPEQRQQMMQEMMSNIGQFFPGGAPGGPPPPPR